MSNKTITDTEFQKFMQKFRRYPSGVETSLRAAFEEIEISIIPDPIPEPSNGEIVEDREGDLWVAVEDSWGFWRCVTNSSIESLIWEDLVQGFSPLEVFAKVTP